VSTPGEHTAVTFTETDVDQLQLPTGWRAELIEGEIVLSKAPSFWHDLVASNLVVALQVWSRAHGHGQATTGAGVLYAADEQVIPDAVWASAERLRALDEAGHFQGVGPELVVEVVSPGQRSEQRDREHKLAVYARRDALEYWIADPVRRTLDVYRRRAVGEPLGHAASLAERDTLTTPLLPGFSVRLAEVFAR
jgi:Uma2 family endonuclease